MKTDIIIYSKDRACQLDLLLRSIDLKFENKNNVFVLYDYSNEDFQIGYELVFNKDYGFNVIPIKQDKGTFYNVLKDTVDKITTDFICPFCDDDVFIRNTNLDTISNFINDNTIGIHLRYSQDLTISYHHNNYLPNPKFLPIEDPFILWNWKEYPMIDRWGYPYQGGGLVYRKSFLKHMIDNIKFSLPNSFETAMMSKRNDWGKSLIVGFKHSPIVNVSINRVQNEVNNRGGRDVNISPKQLNDLFLNGNIIDYSGLDNYQNNCEFIEIPLNFIKC